jgi:uncharacterized membrane protein
VEVNTGRVERVVRVVGGIALAVLGLFVLKGVLGVLLALVGAVLVFSGSIGFCHVRKFLGSLGGSKRG